MSVLLNRAGTSSCSSGEPDLVKIFTNRPLVELPTSRLPRISGPIRPFDSSKLFGVAAIAAPALPVIVLKVIVGRVLSTWIGVKDCAWESTRTWPPP